MKSFFRTGVLVAMLALMFSACTPPPVIVGLEPGYKVKPGGSFLLLAEGGGGGLLSSVGDLGKNKLANSLIRNGFTPVQPGQEADYTLSYKMYYARKQGGLLGAAFSPNVVDSWNAQLFDNSNKILILIAEHRGGKEEGEMFDEFALKLKKLSLGETIDNTK